LGSKGKSHERGKGRNPEGLQEERLKLTRKGERRKKNFIEGDRSEQRKR